MAARLQRHARDLTMGLWDGEIDDEVRRRGGERRGQVCRGLSVQAELRDPALCRLEVQIHDGDYIDALRLERREPRA